MKALLALCCLCLTVQAQNYNLPDEDLGTVPVYEYTHYLVSDEPDITGMRVVHPLNPTMQLVYEFVDMHALLSPVAASTYVAPPGQVGVAWSYADDMTDRQVFEGGNLLLGAWAWEEWTNGPPQYASCELPPCQAQNSICSRWCSMGIGNCLCTPYEDRSSKTTAKQHQQRLKDAFGVFPPDPQGSAPRPPFRTPHMRLRSPTMR